MPSMRRGSPRESSHAPLTRYSRTRSSGISSIDTHAQTTAAAPGARSPSGVWHYLHLASPSSDLDDATVHSNVTDSMWNLDPAEHVPDLMT